VTISRRGRADVRVSPAMRDPAPGFESPPPRLVEDNRQHLGRFHGPSVHANLLDAPYRRLPRLLRRWRLKEWQAIQIATPHLFVNAALFDAKLLQLLQVKVYDRIRNEKYLHERQLRPGAFRIADDLAASSNAYRDRRSPSTPRACTRTRGCSPSKARSPSAPTPINSTTRSRSSTITRAITRT
jgi:hypothetical protein